MKFIKNLFIKKAKKQHNIYSEMGSIGVSPSHMMMYEESIKKIKEYDLNNRLKG